MTQIVDPVRISVIYVILKRKIQQPCIVPYLCHKYYSISNIHYLIRQNCFLDVLKNYFIENLIDKIIRNSLSSDIQTFRTQDLHQCFIL